MIKLHYDSFLLILYSLHLYIHTLFHRYCLCERVLFPLLNYFIFFLPKVVFIIKVSNVYKMIGRTKMVESKEIRLPVPKKIPIEDITGEVAINPIKYPATNRIKPLVITVGILSLNV